MGVVHGRFQVLHLDHMAYIMAAKELCSRIIVGITNPDPGFILADQTDPGRSLESNNPLTYYERLWLIEAALRSRGLGPDEYLIVPMPINRPEFIRYYVPPDATYFLTIYDQWGDKKLETLESLGLECHVLWKRPEEQKNIKGRELRLKMARGGNWEDQVPEACIGLLKAWHIPERLKKAVPG